MADTVHIYQDMLSYNKEQATGDDRYNILTVVMHQLNLTLPDAVKWAVTYYDETKKKFLDGMKRIPSWGKEIDEQVAMYVAQLAVWPRGNACWCFESGRYFGSKGLGVQKTRQVKLLPKRRQATDLHRENAEIVIVDSM